MIFYYKFEHEISL